MHEQGTAAAPRGPEAAPEKYKRVFLLAEHAPLPEGVEESEEDVVVIRMIGVTREMVEAENVAY